MSERVWVKRRYLAGAGILQTATPRTIREQARHGNHLDVQGPIPIEHHAYIEVVLRASPETFNWVFKMGVAGCVFGYKG